MIYLDDVASSSRKVTKDLYDAIKASAHGIVNHMEEYGISERVAAADRIRYCIWSGQHYSERKYGDEEYSAFPFDGASDIRFRLADYLTNVRVAECFAALMRSQISFGSIGSEVQGENGEPVDPGKELAVRAAELWEEIRERDLSLEWVTQMLLLANYLHGDGKGVAGLMVGWDRRIELRSNVLTADDLRQMVMDQGGSPEFVGAMLYDAAEAVDYTQIELFFEQFNLVNRKYNNIRKVVSDLSKLGMAEVLQEEITKDCPTIRALQLGSELWIDPTTLTANGDDAETLHIVEWMSKAKIRAVAAEEGWNRKFVEDLLEAKALGQGLFPQWRFDNDGQTVIREESAVERGLYQIVRTYFIGVSDDGIVSRNMLVWCGNVDTDNYNDIMPVREAHGGWPVQIYSSEVNGAFALDARGIPEQAAGLQSHGKISLDTIANISQLQLPPIKSKGRRDKGTLLIEPLGEIETTLTGDISFMAPPQVPDTTLRYLSYLGDLRDMFFGLPNDKISPVLWQSQQTMRVWFWLAQVSDTVRRIVTLALAVRNGGKVEKVNVRMRCDPREWDSEYVNKTADTLYNLIMPMDRKATLRTEKIVEDLVLALMPEHARALTRSIDSAADDTIKDEQKSYMLIRGGIRPQVPPPGSGSYDYSSRLNFYQTMMQQNPNAFSDMGQDKQQLLQEHIKALQFGVQQEENKMIGRTGVRSEAPAVDEVQ